MRVGYGALQLAAPALGAGQLLGRPIDARARLVIRVLGARQLGQAVASGTSPSYPILALGVEVDLIHAATMIALGPVDRRRRTIAVENALIAASFALAGALAARACTPDHRHPDSRLDSLRQKWAARLAGAFVPGYPTTLAVHRRAAEGRTSKPMADRLYAARTSNCPNEKR